MARLQQHTSPGERARRIERGAALLTTAALFAFVLLGFAVGSEARAQTAAPSQPAQGRVVGEVVSVDAAAGRISVRVEGGAQKEVLTNERTAVLSLPPGVTDPARAARVTLADIAAGDRLFARGTPSADNNSVTASQIVVTKVTPPATARSREEWRTRGLGGRVTAVDPRAKRITVAARGREGVQDVVVDASGANVRFLRFAPDSLDVQQAVPGTLADVRVGDQLRALGERSADGARFTPEEVVTGSVLRFGGTVTAVNAARNELTVRGEGANQTITVAVGTRTSLRRVTPEVAAEFAQRAERREQRRANREGSDGQRRQDGERRREGADGERPQREGGEGQRARREGGEGRPGGRAGGRGLQGMFENLPAVTLAELKPGDTVLVTATTGASPDRVTAVSLLTGEAEFITRLLRTQGRGGPRDTNTGLPGDVIGGGAPPERPQP